MTLSTLLALATFCLVTAITPGPNNTLVLASGATFGFQRTLPHLFGIALGYAFMLLAIGLGIGSLFQIYPSLYDLLRILATFYMLWLAWRIASSASLSEVRDTARPMSFLQAAAFQWVNPKGWASALGALTAYASPNAFPRDVFIVTAVFTAIVLPSIAVWTSFGLLLRRCLSRRGALRAFNVVMALLLVASLYPIWAGFKASASWTHLAGH
jgi:threonine/homoserine/homoserine lactone efflux protein